MESTSEAELSRPAAGEEAVGLPAEAKARVELRPVGADLGEPRVGTMHGRRLRGGNKHQGSGLKGFCVKKTHQV